jgi:phage gp29-like protein
MISPLMIFNRLASGAGRALNSISAQVRVAVANLWRDQYNPLRGLTIRRAVALLEDETRGAFADLQWTYRAIEGQDATLGALVERRCGAIEQLDWDIKVRDDVPEEKKAIAAQQQKALKAAYELIENLTESFENLALASFRGYAHLEKIEDAAGNVIRLELVEQWYWCREGLNGEWTLNKDASPGRTKGDEIDLSRFIVREVSRPINRVAIICHVRKGLSQKDWDAYVEEFGIPSVFIILPKDVPADKVDEYIDAANAITSNSRGALPGGSDVKTVESSKGSSPFLEHIEHQDKCLVLRGTGGLLTMLAESGTGTLAGSAHQQAFDLLARAEARKISDVLQQQFDKPILDEITPGEQRWAYFELASAEENDPAQIVTDVTQLEGAGLRVDVAWIEEKSGYPVTRAAEITTEKPTGVAGPLRGFAAALQARKGDIGAEKGNPPLKSNSVAILNNRENPKSGDSEGAGDMPDAGVILAGLIGLIETTMKSGSTPTEEAIRKVSARLEAIGKDDADLVDREAIESAFYTWSGEGDRIENRGGFRTLEDGRVIYIDDVETESDSDNKAGEYRDEKSGGESKEKAPKGFKYNSQDSDGGTSDPDLESSYTYLSKSRRGEQPPAEDELKGLLNQSVELPDGSAAEVLSYNLNNGQLTVQRDHKGFNKTYFVYARDVKKKS